MLLQKAKVLLREMHNYVSPTVIIVTGVEKKKRVTAYLLVQLALPLGTMILLKGM